jgi:hypothetical protein
LFILHLEAAGPGKHSAPVLFLENVSFSRNPHRAKNSPKISSLNLFSRNSL